MHVRIYDGLLYIAPPVPAYQRSAHLRISRLLVHDCGRGLKEIISKHCRNSKYSMKEDECGRLYLMIWKYQRISYDNIFPPRSVKYHNFSNIVRGEGFTATVEKLVLW